MYKDIQDKIVEKLRTIDGIGQVMAYHQRAITKEEFESLFQVDLDQSVRPVRAWIVVWESASATRVRAPTLTFFVNHIFSVTGYFGWREGAEEDIRMKAERILEEFARYITLGLHDLTQSSTIVEDSNVAIRRFGREFLGPVLCAVAEIEITAMERRVPESFE